MWLFFYILSVILQCHNSISSNACKVFPRLSRCVDNLNASSALGCAASLTRRSFLGRTTPNGSIAVRRLDYILQTEINKAYNGQDNEETVQDIAARHQQGAKTTALSASSPSRRGQEKGQSNKGCWNACLNDLMEQCHPLLNVCSNR